MTGVEITAKTWSARAANSITDKGVAGRNMLKVVCPQKK
jgi:hypothetical protein